MVSLLEMEKLARDQFSGISSSLQQLRNIVPSFVPTLTILQIGKIAEKDAALAEYMQTCTSLGFDIRIIKLNTDSSLETVKKTIKKLNEDHLVDGILVQADSKENKFLDEVFATILPIKDVTVSNMDNSVECSQHINAIHFLPVACSKLIFASTGDSCNLKGKHALILTDDTAFGIELGGILIQNECVITVCQPSISCVKQMSAQADILIVNVQHVNFVKEDWLKNEAIVIDCGYDIVESKSEKADVKGCGGSNEAARGIKYLTVVPPGILPLAAAVILENTLHQAVICKLGGGSDSKWKLRCLTLDIKSPVPPDHVISRAQNPKCISELAREVGILRHELDLYGDKMAKVSLEVLKRLQLRPDGKYIVVAGITPTPLGEGKSTAVFGLVQALCKYAHENAFACVRQPSQGPTFGIKGGSAGGGYAQAIPMEQFNLHLTGDVHAVTAANNLLAAAIDARIFHENTQSDEALFNRLVPADKNGVRCPSEVQKRRLLRLGIPVVDDLNVLSTEQKRRFSRLNIDPKSITWARVIDTNDRFLREIEIGHGPQEKGQVRRTRFDIAVASELMAILALTTDLHDMKRRIARIVVANDLDGNPVTADDIGVTGALTVLMKDAVRPTLMQSLEGTPILVHTGPFANIAHGQGSILSDKVALKLVGPNGYVVTEAGFGADIGMEKFFNIKCRYSGLQPNAVVIVATVRALKMHGGGPVVTPGAKLSHEYLSENIPLVVAGCDSNLKKQIENAKKFGVPVVVCVNQFCSDTDRELQVVVSKALEYGAYKATVSNHWAQGGAGAIALAEAVIEACKVKSNFRFLYDLTEKMERKMEIIANEIYGADGIEILPAAKKKLELYEKQGYGELPICMAKTQYSLSADPTKKGVPKGFTIPILDVRASIGAGFIYPLCGEIQTMPGLPTRPCFFDIDIDPKTEEIVGML